MTIRRRILHGAPIGRWHRIAYRNLSGQCAVAYPIGLHLIARFFRRVWEWSYRYKPSRLERLYSNARRAAYRKGNDDGYGQGHYDGFEQGEVKGRKAAEHERLGWDAFFQHLPKRGKGCN